MRVKYENYKRTYKKEIMELMKDDRSELSQIIGNYLKIELARYNPIDDRIEIPLHMIKDEELRFIRMNLVAGQLIGNEIHVKIGNRFLALWIK